jgi:hypothetical protein
MIHHLLKYFDVLDPLVLNGVGQAAENAIAVFYTTNKGVVWLSSALARRVSDRRSPIWIAVVIALLQREIQAGWQATYL